MLSSRLNAFVRPTIQNRPRGIATHSAWTSCTVVPVESTMTAPAICAPSFHFAGSDQRSSTSPAAKSSVAPAKRPTSALLAVSGPSATASQMPAVIPA